MNFTDAWNLYERRHGPQPMALRHFAEAFHTLAHPHTTDAIAHQLTDAPPPVLAEPELSRKA